LGLGGVGCGGADTAPKGKGPPNLDTEKSQEEMMKNRKKMGERPTGPGGEAEKDKEKEKDKSKDKEKE
jgi:hypothetical protein